uniref:Uncharacterized protein n=1 Tax=Prolemur simus TaxID=1328070 RepID=A0A8C9DPH4_PROSS
MELARDRVQLRWATEQHVPEVGVQVKHGTASLRNREPRLCLGRSQQQQVPVVCFQHALMTFLPRGLISWQ